MLDAQYVDQKDALLKICHYYRPIQHSHKLHCFLSALLIDEYSFKVFCGVVLIFSNVESTVFNRH